MKIIKKYPRGPHGTRKLDKPISIKFDDMDFWNLDITISEILLPIMKEYKSRHNGAPIVERGDISDRDYDSVDDESEHGYSIKRYNLVLDEIIFAFEFIKSGGMMEFEMDKEQDRAEKGLELFTKYFTSFWS